MNPSPKTDRLATMPLGHDIIYSLKQTLIDRFAGNNLDKQLDAHAMMEAWRKELADPFPTPVEEILVERLVVCRFNSYLADLEVERAVGLWSPAQLAAMEKRRDGANRRFLAAVKTLETVRRKALAGAESGTVNTRESRCEPVNRLAGMAWRN